MSGHEQLEGGLVPGLGSGERAHGATMAQGSPAPDPIGQSVRVTVPSAATVQVSAILKVRSLADT